MAPHHQSWHQCQRLAGAEVHGDGPDDDAISWIQQQRSSGKPWMCTASYSAIHTPYQQPPTNLYPPDFTWPTNLVEANTNEAQIKIISNLMLYAMDQEVGRLLVGAGLATRLPSGALQYTPAATDTMVIVCGDNGTYYESVNTPYNPLRAKATPYQTGVAAPVFVCGPSSTTRVAPSPT